MFSMVAFYSVYDVEEAFMRRALGGGSAWVGRFRSLDGACECTQGLLVQPLLRRFGLGGFTRAANVLAAAGYLALGAARRPAQMAMGLMLMAPVKVP
jgi:hypothetical protein